MKEVERIADQLHRAFAGPAWHGPSVLELLKGVTANQAAVRSIEGAHTIWELVAHIGAWEEACLRRLQGDRAELADEEDWAPLADFSEQSWEELKARLANGHEALIKAIAGLEESKLDKPILPGMPSVYVTLHGAVQHDLYHAGQIAILKKAVSEDT